MKTLFALIILLAASTVALAQDTVQIHVGFSNLNVANQNLPGGVGSVDYKIWGNEKWRLGAVGEFAFFDDTNDLLNRRQLLAGTSIARKFGDGRLSVFGRALFGNTRFDSSTMGDFDRVTVSAGGGLDVNVGNFFVRPVSVDIQYIDERPVRYTRLGAGVGVRF